MANICLFCLLCVLNLRSGEARVAMTNAIKGATEKVQEPLHERVCTAVVALAAACVSRTAPSASWHKIQTASHAFRMPGSDVTRETEVLSIRRSKYRRTSRLMTVQFGRCRATHAQHTHIHTRARAQVLNIVAQGKTRFPVMCFLCLLPDHFKCRVTMAILFNREIFIKRRLTENYRFQSKPASDQNINWTWNQLTPAPPSQRNEPKRGNDCAIHAPASQSHTSHEWVMTSVRGAMLLQHASGLKAVGQLRKATDRQTDRAPQPDIEGQ